MMETLPNLRHLRVFRVAAELQSISRAADAASLTQPAVTQAIAKLEGQLGALLFERSGSGSFLSEAGKILLFRVGLMFTELEEALSEVVGSTARSNSAQHAMLRITAAQLRALSAVAQSSSFAEAGRKLGVSGVALHRNVREFERTIGKPLFQQGALGMIANRTGQELARRIALALREWGWAVEEIQLAQGRRGGQLRLGAMPLAGGYLLGAVLQDVMREYPDSRAKVRTADGRDLEHMLRSGEIDLIVGMNRSSTDPREIVQEALVPSPFVLVGRRGHPLASLPEVSLKALQDYRWVVPAYGATRRGVFEQLFSRMEKPPVADIEVNALSTIRTVLEMSDRLTLLTRFEFEFEQASTNLVTLNFPSIPHIHSIGMAWRRNWVPTLLHLSFLNIIRSRAASMV